MAIFCCKNMSKLDTVVYLRFYLRLKYGQDYIMLMHHASCLHPLKPYMCAWVGSGAACGGKKGGLPPPNINWPRMKQKLA